MNKLQNLINELCPNGVEFKPLYQVTIWDKRFKDVPKQWQEKTTKFKHISAKLLKSLANENGDIRLLSTGKFIAYTTIDLAQSYLNDDEVLSIPSGGVADIKYYNGKFVDSGNILAISKDKEKYNLKFIYYYLLMQNKKISNLYFGSCIAHPQMKAILSLQIPIPPLEIQNEIVRILDTFTELQTELQTELLSRRKQYEYYRNKLLSKEALEKRARKHYNRESSPTCHSERSEESQNAESKLLELVEFKALGEVCEINQFKQIGASELENLKRENCKNLIKLMPSSKNYDWWSDRDTCKNLICSGEVITLGRARYANIKYYKGDFVSSNNHIIQSKTNSTLNTRFLYFFIDSNVANFYVPTATYPKFDNDKFKKFQIPIPPLEVQEEIVRILDKFDALVNDLNIGIPAEIKGRKKQYEYYRNKLLSFENNEIKCNS